MFSKLFTGTTVLICAHKYFTPPSRFDGSPSQPVKEWMDIGASRKAAELLIWHRVYLKSSPSPTAVQLYNGGGWTWATAELMVLGYRPGPKGWDEPVRPSLLGKIHNAILALL